MEQQIICVVMSLLSLVTTVTGIISETKFEIDRVCWDSVYGIELSLFTNDRGTKYCSAQCSQDSTCTSFQYDQVSGLCRLNSQKDGVRTASGCSTLIYYGESVPLGPVTYAGNLDGQMWKLVNQADGLFWHYDGCCAKHVSGLWQPDDNYVRFTFELQTDDSYKIRSKATGEYICDGFGVTGAQLEVLNSLDTIDEYQRFQVIEVSPGFYRVKTQATGRYVRMDEDKRVSSRYNVRDNYALFTFEP